MSSTRGVVRTRSFKAVWQAAVLGIVLGGAVEAVMAAHWVQRFLAGSDFRSVFIAGISGLPGMMCSCCATPVVVGMRRRKVSAGASFAFWMANPALNPATLAVLFLVLGWKFGLRRLVFAAATVFGVSYAWGRLFPEEDVPAQASPGSCRGYPGPPELLGAALAEGLGRPRRLDRA